MSMVTRGKNFVPMMADLGMNALWALIGLPMSLLSFLYFLFNQKKKVVLQDKVCFITGASSGLGEACAIAFHNCGCKVVLAGRSEQKLLELKQRLDMNKLAHHYSPAICVIDLQDESVGQITQEAVARIWGTVDILINNAGMSYRGTGVGTKLSVDKKLMDVNHFGHIEVTKAILPSMIRNTSGGHIVCVSSVQGRLAIPHRSSYAASKHALQAYFDCLRPEVEQYNISVCVVSPYYIRTNLSLNALSGDGSTYGKMDETTNAGYDPHFVAQKIVTCVQMRHEELILAPAYVKLAICMRVLAPWLYFKIMSRRAKKDRIQSHKKE